jgi:hypothetical protein
MKRSPHIILCIALILLLSCLMLVPFVSAAKTTTVVTTKATVPPILQACSHATYPTARFACAFPGNQSATIPDGPPYTLECADASTSEPGQQIVSWSWEFGDGGSSTLQNPLYSYARAGKYDIRLTVTTFCGRQYSSTTVNSTSVYCTVPEPAFTTNVTEGFAPLVIQVTDASLNTRENMTTWTYWVDNTPVSQERNPVFTLTTPGTYTISQTVWKDCVPADSALNPPFTRQIKVNASPSALAAVSDMNTPPATTLTSAVPVTSVTSGVPVSITATATVQKTRATGTLSMSTEPAGVLVYVDNVLRGTSPATVPALSAGSHTVRLEKEGYQNMTVPVRINEGKVTTISTTLTPEPAGIAIVPVIALAVIILLTVIAGIYLFLRQRKY